MMTNETLFESMMAYNFDEAYQKVDISFEQKMLESNLGWSKDYLNRTITEYKKLMYLAAVYRNIAPSDPIDQVWHQHILYTKDYRTFCERYMGFFLNHNPERFNFSPKSDDVDIYKITLDYYRKEFNQEPPLDIWVLDAKDHARINLATHYVLPVNDLKSIIKIFFNELKHKLKLWK